MPLFVDGRELPAAPDKNLLEHLLALGYDLPYFCWHPAMGSVGACRQCAVKQFRDANDRTGRIVMACMTPALDGTHLGFDEPEARDFRARVIEWLMVNHPHDCPVCEEGGECHLQDMTVMTGHNYRRYRGLKRTFRNQYLGPFVNHEMNRCIACYRCVRFYQDYAGGADLRAFGIHNTVFFGRAADGVLENEFSGNLAEVCPTGVFTDKTFADQYVRKWDLQAAPSVCVHCGVGCNTSAQERYGKLRRIVNRYNGAVNGYFICDRGRFGYGFVNAPTRVRRPLVRSAASQTLEPASPEAALARAAELIADGTIGIGSPRASLEANFALRRLVGAENFYLGAAPVEHALLMRAAELATSGFVRMPTLRDVERADAVLVLGEDPTATAPRLALALRQTARNRQFAAAAKLKIPTWLDAAVRTAGQDDHTPVFMASSAATKLDDVATQAWRGTLDEIAALGEGVAAALEEHAPAGAPLADHAAALARTIAATLGAAERPLVVTGISTGHAAVLEAAATVARALHARRGAPVDLYVALPEANSMGAALLGGAALDVAFARARGRGVGAAIVLENDLARRVPAATLARFFADVPHVIAIDQLQNATVHAADVVLPAATFAESDGTLVSNEGRAQRFFQVYAPEGDVRESWRWLAALATARGADFEWHALDDVTRACAAAAPALARILDAAPPAKFRIVGRRIAREPARYSGRTAMRAHVEISERPPPPDPDAPLAFSMEGYYGPRVPPPLMPFAWSPGWNSNQSINKFQDEIGGPLRGGDPGVRLLEPDGSARSALVSKDDQRPRQPDGSAPSRDARSPMSTDRRATAGGELRVVRLARIFGGEELSAHSPPIAERIEPPHALLHPLDAAVHELADGDRAEIALDATTLELPIRVQASLARGVLGLPAGVAPPLDAATTRVTIRRAGAQRSR